MTKQEKQLNIYEKLIEVRKKVLYLQKDSKAYNFKYANEDSILSAIRPSMDELGLFLEFEMTSLSQISDKTCQAEFTFTWVNASNPKEKTSSKMFLQTVTGDTQKIGGLATYANRYFLYKYFNVPTGDLDPDARSELCSAKQISAIEAAINGDKALRDGMLKFLNVKEFAAIPADQYGTVIDTITKKKRAQNA